MKKSKLKTINKIYLMFLIIVLIIIIIFSFKTGGQMYYLINTNLSDNNTLVKSGIANWRLEVTIEY